MNLEIKDENGRPLDYCGIRCTLEVLGGKYTMLVIAQLATTNKRFKEIKSGISGLSDTSLSRTLDHLDTHGLISKSDAIHPVYSLTEYGKAVIPLLSQIFEWGENHFKKY